MPRSKRKFNEVRAKFRGQKGNSPPLGTNSGNSMRSQLNADIRDKLPHSISKPNYKHLAHTKPLGPKLVPSPQMNDDGSLEFRFESTFSVQFDSKTPYSVSAPRSATTLGQFPNQIRNKSSRSNIEFNNSIVDIKKGIQ